MKSISVVLSATIHRRLARVSQQSGLSPATIIRHAVKKQLLLWEANVSDTKTLASKIGRKATAECRAAAEKRSPKNPIHQNYE
jgi:hypothetical protein